MGRTIGQGLAPGLLEHMATKETDTSKRYAPDGEYGIAVVSDVGGFNSPLTTKGDILGYTDTEVRIPVGGDGTVLVAASSTPSGLKFATLSAGVGTGDVVGPPSVIEKALASFADTSGDSIEDVSGMVHDGLGNLSISGNLDLGGNLTTSGNVSTVDVIVSGTVDGVDVANHDHSGAGQGGTVSHGDLSNADADDHTQYHTDARAAVLHFGKAEHVNSSLGAGDAGKPIVLDAGGQVDATMVNDGDIDHVNIANKGTNTHAQIDTHIADDTVHFTYASTSAHIATASIHFNEASIDHVNIANKGTNTHAQIDTHIGSTSTHFTEASIDHVNIANKGTNTHAQIDTHLADSTEHFTEASIDHTNITNIGTNTHAQIDTHLADSTEHFTEASIDHVSISNIGTIAHASIDTHIGIAVIASASLPVNFLVKGDTAARNVVTTDWQCDGSDDVTAGGDLDMDSNDVTNIRVASKSALGTDTSSSGNVTIAFNSANLRKLTLTENITSMSFGAPPGPGVYKILITQGSGPYTITGTPAAIDWVDTTAPTLPTGNGERCLWIFEYDGTDYLGVQVGTWAAAS